MKTKNKYDADWWSKVEEEASASIRRGLKQAKEGKVISHEDVMKKHKKWFNHKASLRD